MSNTITVKWDKLSDAWCYAHEEYRKRYPKDPHVTSVHIFEEEFNLRAESVIEDGKYATRYYTLTFNTASDLLWFKMKWL